MFFPRQLAFLALVFATILLAGSAHAQSKSIVENGSSARVEPQKRQQKIVFVRADPSMDMVANMMGAPGYARTAIVDPRKDEIAIMNPDGSGIKDLHVNGMDPV